MYVASHNADLCSIVHRCTYVYYDTVEPTARVVLANMVTEDIASSLMWNFTLLGQCLSCLCGPATFVTDFV